MWWSFFDTFKRSDSNDKKNRTQHIDKPAEKKLKQKVRKEKKTATCQRNTFRIYCWCIFRHTHAHITSMLLRMVKAKWKVTNGGILMKTFDGNDVKWKIFCVCVWVCQPENKWCRPYARSLANVWIKLSGNFLCFFFCSCVWCHCLDLLRENLNQQ